MNSQKLLAYIEHLQKIHDELDKQIEEDIKNYQEDRLVSVLKKKKLAIKDEIQKYNSELLLNDHDRI
jgi:hypothetical protein